MSLGDLTPGDDDNDADYRQLYKFFIAIYLIVGISGMLLLMATITDIPSLNFSRFFILPPNNAEKIIDEETSLNTDVSISTLRPMVN